MRKATFLYAALACWAWRAGTAHGGIIINVGDHVLAPNTPNQTVYINVTGGTAVQGIQLEVQVADGGPLGGGVQVGPTITSLDVINGTIFASNNTGQTGTDTGQIIPQVASRGTTTASGTVVASGVLATIVFDTTGFDTPGQTWDLRLTGTLNGDTVSGEITPTIVNGTISIVSDVPEPGTLLAMGVGAGMLWRRRKSRRRILRSE